MIRIIKSLLPPVFVNLAKSLWGMRYGFREGFATYDEALKKSGSYEQNSIIQATVRRTANVISQLNSEEIMEVGPLEQQLLSAFLVLLDHWKEKRADITVLDFGGALGAQYLHLRSLLPEKNFERHILETSASACAGREMYKSLGFNAPPRFFDDFSQANDCYDIVLASGALQYVQNPEKTFMELTKRSNLGLIINRFPAGSFGNDFITVQKVPPASYQASYPAWFFDLAKWEQIFKEKCDIRFKWQVPVDVTFIRGTSLTYSGYVLLKSASRGSCH